MKLIKRLFFFVSLLVLLLLIGSYLLPQKQRVERSIDISAPADMIYPYLANPKLFSEWSPWSEIDPEMKVQYVGAASGVGAGMTWQSNMPSVGSGSWTVTQAIENESLNVEMDFGEQGIATSFFTLKTADNNTNLTWGFDTDAGNDPVMRWMGLLMDKMVGTEYEKGLQELKTLVEK